MPRSNDFVCLLLAEATSKDAATMAQPDLGNPFAAPPVGGPPGEPVAQQQPMQSGNPFGSYGAQPAPSHPQPTTDPFASPPAQAPKPDGNAAAASVPPQENPFNMYGSAPHQQELAQQQGFMPEAQVQQQQPQQTPQSDVHQQQQSFAPQSQVAVPQVPYVQQPQQQGFVPEPQVQAREQPQQGMPPQQPQAQQAYAPQPQFVAPQSLQGMQPQVTHQQQPPQAPVAGVLQQPLDPFSNALVPSAQPANPYAGYAQPAAQPGNPFEMVPVAQQQQSQWGIQAASFTGSAASFDPFAPPPPPAPAPQAPAPPPASNEIVPASAPQGYYQAPEFPFDPDHVAPAEDEQKAHGSSVSVGPPVSEVNAVHGGHSVVSEPETTVTRRSVEDNREIVPYRSPQPSPQNKYSQALARNAPPGCAPLPKGELVMKSGYILARISFRTILMKKWKQTYWIQYGRHTMLWFRSENHFNEWLSNPYLSQAQRNFLVKLAINFVHDLYKPNVRGYQVTQSHTKPYGRKLVRQFKLERWMDYGPTIAAAFGSPDQREVDELRQTIIDCMRNTPLENGIRATGAVRQGHDEHRDGNGDQGYSYDDYQPRGRSKY